jgi:hypothetical protein
MPWGGKRTGAGRPTDNKNRKNIHYRLDASTAETFATDCEYLRVPLNAVLEMLMTEWMSDQRVEIEQAHAELKVKGTKEFFKRPCSPDNLEHLNKIRADRRQKLATVKCRLAKWLRLS